MKCHTTPRTMDDFQLHRTIWINVTYNAEQKRSEGIHTPIFHSYEVQKQTKSFMLLELRVAATLTEVEAGRKRKKLLWCWY